MMQKIPSKNINWFSSYDALKWIYSENMGGVPKMERHFWVFSCALTAKMLQIAQNFLLKMVELIEIFESLYNLPHALIG